MVSGKLLSKAGEKGREKFGIPGMVAAIIAVALLQVLLESVISDLLSEEDEDE